MYAKSDTSYVAVRLNAAAFNHVILPSLRADITVKYTRTYFSCIPADNGHPLAFPYATCF
jgi:hypothetical protein